MDQKQLVDFIALESIPSARGRRPAVLSLEYARDLGTERDLELIRNPPKLGSTTPVLKQLRNTHHMAARLLAEGKSNNDVSLITGYSPSRISILQDDPAFEELIAYYKANVEAQYINVHERLASLGMASLEELQERLEVSPGTYAVRELMELAELCLDRSVTQGAVTSAGAGKGGLTVNVNFVPAPTKEQPVTIDMPVTEAAE